MLKNPLVSDRLFAETDTASAHSAAPDEAQPADWALGLVEKRVSVANRSYSNVTQKNIAIQGDTCFVVICDLATPERNWAEFRRKPPGAESLTSEYGSLCLNAEAEQAQPAILPVGPRSRSLAQRFAIALKLHDTEDALDEIFEAVDLALLAGQFRECDRALASIDVDEWPTDLLGGLLSITAAASHELPARAAFFERTRRALIKRGDDTPGLLDGLE